MFWCHQLSSFYLFHVCKESTCLFCLIGTHHKLLWSVMFWMKRFMSRRKNLLCHGLDDALCLYKVCKHQSFINNTIHYSSFFLWKSKNTLIKHHIWLFLLKTLQRNQLMIHLINILINILIKPLRILPFIMVIKKKKGKKNKKNELISKEIVKKTMYVYGIIILNMFYLINKFYL